MKIAVLASGAGTNTQAIFDKSNAGVLDAQVAVVISNNPQAEVLNRAARAGIRSKTVNHRQYADRRSFDLAVGEVVENSGAELIVLAGWMRLFTNAFLRRFKDRVINIHPALLPSFPGVNGIGDALAYGVKITGVTVHFVDEKTDSGPVIIQGAIPVQADEERERLASRIHEVEHRILPQAIQWFAQGRVHLEGRKVSIAESNIPKAALAPDMLVWPPLEESF